MFELDGESLTRRQIAGASTSAGPVSVTDAARRRVEESFRFAAHAAGSRQIYGRSTGVGANRDDPVEPSAEQSLRLLRSHATSAGAPRSRRRVRATLLVRLNQLAAGGSGISPAVVEALAALLSTDAQPVIRELGSIGTADLTALATVGLALTGDVACTPAFDRPVTFAAGDGLPFVSSNAATIADAALAADDLARLAMATLVVASLSFHALRGNPEAFSPLVPVASPFPGVRTVCAAMTGLVSSVGTAVRIQDPFGLRSLPQVHGAFVDALTRLDGVIEAMANAASENPLLLPELGVAHHGGFHAVYLGQAVDAGNSALAQTAQLSLARLTNLNDPALTGARAFLAGLEPGSSGVMVVEYVAASALAELRSYATPTGLQSISLSRGVEDDASFASLAARHMLRGVDSYSVLLACELVAAVRCLRMAGFDPVGAPATLGRALQLAEALPASTVDRDLTADIGVATELLPELADLIDPA